MRIIISIATLSAGGAERVVSIIANSLVSQGHEVELLLYYNRPIWYHLDPKVSVVIDEDYIGKTNPVKHMLWRRKHIRDAKIDVVLSFLASFNILCIIATMGLKIPLIVCDRSDPRFSPKNHIIRNLRDTLYRFADGVVVQTKRNQSYFDRRIQPKSTVIYNPIQLGEMCAQGLRTEKRKRIVSVGRLIPSKNLEILLFAFAQIQARFSDYELIIYGDGPSRGKLESLILQLGLERKIFLPGNIQNVFCEICCAELFILSSNYEGMPNALLEAMCLGMPVISTKVSGATDVIQDKMNGILVEVGDVNALANAIAELLEDEDKRRQYAIQAVELNGILNTKEITNQWVDYIKQVCAGYRN